MSTTNSTPQTAQPVAAISRYVLAHLLTGVIGARLFENGLDIELLNEIIYDIEDGVSAGLPKVEESVIHQTIMELETKSLDKED